MHHLRYHFDQGDGLGPHNELGEVLYHHGVGLFVLNLRKCLRRTDVSVHDQNESVLEESDYFLKNQNSSKFLHTNSGG